MPTFATNLGQPNGHPGTECAAENIRMCLQPPAMPGGLEIDLEPYRGMLCPDCGGILRLTLMIEGQDRIRGVGLCLPCHFAEEF